MSIINKDRAFIVAEIGINHEGNVSYAKKLIDDAISAKADAVKFQIYKTESFYNKSKLPELYRFFKNYELGFKDYEDIIDYCRKKGIFFFATPFDFESVDFLVNMDVKLIKIASSDITNEPFLKYIGDISEKRNIEVLLSTGFADDQVIDKAISFFNKEKLCLMYCVSEYPAKSESIDLNVITYFKKKYNIKIGFSDHTGNIYHSLVAVGLGANVIERHFTDDNSKETSDHRISLDVKQFSEMVKGIREIEKSLGSGIKKVVDFEKKIKYNSMRGIYTKKAIKKGDMIKKEDLLLLRPGNGVPYERYNAIIGSIATKDYIEYEEI